MKMKFQMKFSIYSAEKISRASFGNDTLVSFLVQSARRRRWNLDIGLFFLPIPRSIIIYSATIYALVLGGAKIYAKQTLNTRRVLKSGNITFVYVVTMRHEAFVPEMSTTSIYQNFVFLGLTVPGSAKC